MSADVSMRHARFTGCLLGCACGDVLGAAVEMQPRSAILGQNNGLLRDFLVTDRGFGCYSDDTEMTLALARSILRMKTVDAADCSQAYAEAFTPGRGYGRSAIKVLTALRQGADWRRTGTMLFAAGSFGNGAAMRIAPVGLLFGHLAAAQLTGVVKAAVWMTHSHPEALAAAVLQARAVGLLLAADRPPDPCTCVDHLASYLPESILNEKLRLLRDLLQQRASAEDVAASFGCGVRSADSWPAALWAAMRFIDDPEEAIIQAVNLGGDTDTIGAMTGALVGALHGRQWLPPRWFGNLENGLGGRDELIAVAEKLADIRPSELKVYPP